MLINPLNTIFTPKYFNVAESIFQSESMHGVFQLATIVASLLRITRNVTMLAGACCIVMHDRASTTPDAIHESHNGVWS